MNVADSARQLGLHNSRVWYLESDRPLLAPAGLDSAAVADLVAKYEIPMPAGYRKLLAELGYPETVPAGERSRELAQTRGFRSHGAVVDAVSVATLCFGGGVGLHRVGPDESAAVLTITRASGAERIVPAFSAKRKTIPAGDLVYGIGTGESEFESFAWLGRRDCDAAARQLAEIDCAGVVVALGCPDDSPAHTEGIGGLVAQIIGTVRPDISITALGKADIS